MAATETLISLVVLAISVYLGLKIIKNVIYTIILVLLLAAVLWFSGYLSF